MKLYQSPLGLVKQVCPLCMADHLQRTVIYPHFRTSGQGFGASYFWSLLCTLYNSYPLAASLPSETSWSSAATVHFGDNVELGGKWWKRAERSVAQKSLQDSPGTSNLEGRATHF